MQAPRFWARNGGRLVPALLSPFAAITAAATARRVARPGWHAPVPVICCGNATVGGAGKTTLALDLAARLQTAGVAVHMLTRGYGGQARGPLRVDPARHDATAVGDESLLLAALAPTWVGADRAASAQAAIAAGAQVLLLDDGLQNPTLEKTLTLLVVDGAFGFGNGRPMPAGPLREPIAAAAARCQAAVLVGDDTCGAVALLPPGLPILHTTLRPGPEAKDLAGRRVLAFAGIARPEKFFATLSAVGAVLAGQVGFPDHHPYTEAELRRLLERAHRLDALPVTTPKDAVRLRAPFRAQVRTVGVTLDWHDPDARDALLARAFAGMPG